MILRITFFALMALGLVGFGTVAWISTRPPPPPAVAAAPPAPTKTTVLAAARPTRAGMLLKPEDVASKEIPISEMRPDLSPDTPEARRALSGAMVRRSLSVGEPVRAGDVMRPGDHGFLAAVLGPGMRAVTVGVDAITGSAGLIWPGDRVDLILTQTIAESHDADRSSRCGRNRAVGCARHRDRSAARARHGGQRIRRPGTHCHVRGDAGTGRACLGRDTAWPSVAGRAVRRNAAAWHAARGRAEHDMGGRCLTGTRGRRHRHRPRTPCKSTRAALTQRSSSSDEDPARNHSCHAADRDSGGGPWAEPGRSVRSPRPPPSAIIRTCCWNPVPAGY